MSVLVRNQFMAGEDNNYLIAGNICNAFVLGTLGSQDDFFLVGSEPEHESNYPMLTGNILDSEGQVLFRLVRNMLIINPGNCSKILGNHVGYEIHDAHGIMIFSVKTLFDTLPGLPQKSFVTTLAGRFFNKHGEMVLSANSGEPDEQLLVQAPCAFGFGGGFGFVQNMAREDLEFARFILGTRGRIHEQFRGVHEGEEFTLDGKALFDAKVRGCTIHVNSGAFILAGACEFVGSNFMFHEEAENLRNLVLALISQKQKFEQPTN